MPTNPQPSSSVASAPEPSDSEVNAQLKERFRSLPKVVQDAITSADVQKQLRAVSDNHKLHLDQWGILENEVMMTLLGFQEPKDLAGNIQSEVGVTADEAATLAGDINKIVFEPIRAALERGLEHPEAKEEVISGAEAARQSLLAAETPPETTATTTAPSGPVPATPPPAPPTEKAVRAPISSSYSARQASSERKSVEGDPYRELP